MITVKGKYNEAIIFTNEVDDNTLSQVSKLLDQPFTKGLTIRIMPDCHSGIGCVIGTTMTIKDKVVPNLVGVDIGCGLLVIELGRLNIDLVELDRFIRRNIPSGFNVNKKVLDDSIKLKELRCYPYLRNINYLSRSIGSLGGGNHFIEIDIDEENNKYLIIHSGSRNLGTQIAEHYQKEAVKYHKNVKGIDIPRDLAYLEGKQFSDYLFDMVIAQKFASKNREVMAKTIINHLELDFDKLPKFETVHNYINTKDMILRKGAISAYKGEKLIIPLNMRDGCIIGVGKGNKLFNKSAPHGAGRLMSRKEALRTLDLEDFKRDMEGIYSTSVNRHTLDEAPIVYKLTDMIIEHIKDTVDIVKIIKPIYNFKAK